MVTQQYADTIQFVDVDDAKYKENNKVEMSDYSIFFSENKNWFEQSLEIIAIHLDFQLIDYINALAIYFCRLLFSRHSFFIKQFIFINNLFESAKSFEHGKG